ncbi:TfoX/Sxy family protein [uncultured Sneathiella sp.]|uniref:TfoX/Sxy family protein n=1 Tax=uncultured Sneathiella sp. TaxID=879315 RepID=UPI0030EEB209|tara:strand:+ start:58692 stop:59015 length:324 start_codon:yes stop_codon:yes gene_type:complete
MSHEHTADLLRSALGSRTGISEKKMFGGVCFLLNGNMLCGTGEDRFMFRVGKENEAEALEMPGAEPMVHGGRRMGGFVWVDAGEAIETGLERWTALALRFVGSLPPK